MAAATGGLGLPASAAVLLAFGLGACGTPAARPITDASDDGKSCSQLTAEADKLALDAVQQAAVVRETKERERVYDIVSYVPLVGDVAGIANMVGDVSGSRADAKAAEERDWAGARSAHLREMEVTRCPPVAPVQQAASPAAATVASSGN